MSQSFSQLISQLLSKLVSHLASQLVSQSVPTSQHTHCFFTVKDGRLIFFKHVMITHALCGKNKMFFTLMQLILCRSRLDLRIKLILPNISERKDVNNELHSDIMKFILYSRIKYKFHTLPRIGWFHNEALRS
jgi:hypothetical protein